MDSSDTRTHPVIIDLPRSLERQIARVIIAWACLEWHITQAAHVLVGIGPQTGRIAVREPRMVDRIALVKELIEHLNVKVDFDFKSFTRDASDMAERRDWLAHGIWVNHKPTGKILLRVTKGKWGVQMQDGTAGASRRVYPQGAEVTVSDLKVLRGVIEDLIRRSDGLTTQVNEAVAALPPKRP